MKITCNVLMQYDFIICAETLINDFRHFCQQRLVTLFYGSATGKLWIYIFSFVNLNICVCIYFRFCLVLCVYYVAILLLRYSSALNYLFSEFIFKLFKPEYINIFTFAANFLIFTVIRNSSFLYCYKSRLKVNVNTFRLSI